MVEFTDIINLYINYLKMTRKHNLSFERKALFLVT